MSNAKTDIKNPLPWFDPARHIATGTGIMERATGVALDENGDPVSLAARMMRADAAEAAAATAKPAPKE